MDWEKIDLKQFLEKRFVGYLPSERGVIDLKDRSMEGIIVENDVIYLVPFYPDIDYLYHQGHLLNIEPSEFNNIENIKKGYFGNKDDYVYLATDKTVKPGEPEYDVSLKISFEKLGKPVYRDPESLSEKYEYEYGRAFMTQGPIPKEAIVDCSFPEHIRFVCGLHKGPINFEKYFSKLSQFRVDFKNELLLNR